MVLEPIIVVEDLHVEMGANPVLRGVDLTVRESEIVAVAGENGTGKSTLLRCLAGLRTPTSGEVTVFGAPPRDDATFWRAVAMVAAEPAWYPGLTVREHVELVRVTHEPVGDAWPGVGEMLERCGLTERPTPSRRRSPPASGSGSPWPRHWYGRAGCCSSTSRNTGWTPPSAAGWPRC